MYRIYRYIFIYIYIYIYIYYLSKHHHLHHHHIDNKATASRPTTVSRNGIHDTKNDRSDSILSSDDKIGNNDIYVCRYIHLAIWMHSYNIFIYIYVYIYHMYIRNMIILYRTC
jgi:hypothetical protein